MEFHESENQLKPLLGLVLSVGNFLNNDSARGQVRFTADCFFTNAISSFDVVCIDFIALILRKYY